MDKGYNRYIITLDIIVECCIWQPIINVRILLITACNRINFQFLALLMITLQVINVMSMENLTSYQIKHGGINVKSKCSTISCSGLGLLANPTLYPFRTAKPPYPAKNH